MFAAETVFVLGAGASFEFGLPTGVRLKEQISGLLDIRFDDFGKQTSGDTHITQVLRNAAGRQFNNYQSACWMIRDAMPQSLSIDNFLDAHYDNEIVVRCGKLAIARSIIKAEQECTLMPMLGQQVSSQHYSKSWLIPFAMRLTENLRREEIESAFKSLSFIVFNYDRCLEVALCYILQNYYFIEPAEAQRIVGGANILHPYGSLGPLPWQTNIPVKQLAVDFGMCRSNETLNQISQSIKTFTEKSEDYDLSTKIKNTYCSAEKLVFLGFGFHDLNMQVMSDGKYSNAIKLYGTAIGMSSSDVSIVDRKLLEPFRSREAKPSRYLENLTCSQLLTNFGREISSPI